MLSFLLHGMEVTSVSIAHQSFEPHGAVEATTAGDLESLLGGFQSRITVSVFPTATMLDSPGLGSKSKSAASSTILSTASCALVNAFSSSPSR